MILQARKGISICLLIALVAAGIAVLTACGSEASVPSSSDTTSGQSATTGPAATATTVGGATTTAAGATTTAAGATTTTAGATTTTPPVTEEGGYVTVDVEVAYEALVADETAQLVDVREPAEWAETGVPQGAYLIPLGELERRAPGELEADRPVYVICRSGNRSRTGAAILVGLGFASVFNVDGGIKAWSSAGLPVEPYAP
jgi:phage shock protein E